MISSHSVLDYDRPAPVALPRQPIHVRWVRATFAFLAVMGATFALVFAGPVTAEAADMGGVANPATACPNAQNVKSKDIFDRRGAVIGRIDLRWAYSCSGNWARTTSYMGKLSQIESRAARGDWLSGPGSAYSVDYNVSQNWTYYISLRPSDPACAKGRLFYNGYWQEATVCSDR